jgi:hypothetical protein
MVGQPAPGIARNPDIAISGIIGPITGSIRIPSRPNPSRNPDIPLALDGIPISVRIQIVPVFILRIGGVIAHGSLLGSFLGNGLVPILIPVVPGIAIDALGHHVGGPAVVSPGTNALIFRNGDSRDAVSLYLNRAGDHGHVPAGIESHAQD